MLFVNLSSSHCFAKHGKGVVLIHVHTRDFGGISVCAGCAYIFVMPKRSQSGKGPSEKKFCLVRWLEEETVSVLPIKSAKDGQKVYQGAYANFKWLGKFYEAEVLKVSGNELNLRRCIS